MESLGHGLSTAINSKSMMKSIPKVEVGGRPIPPGPSATKRRNKEYSQIVRNSDSDNSGVTSPHVRGQSLRTDNYGRIMRSSKNGSNAQSSSFYDHVECPQYVDSDGEPFIIWINERSKSLYSLRNKANSEKHVLTGLDYFNESLIKKIHLSKRPEMDQNIEATIGNNGTDNNNSNTVSIPSVDSKDDGSNAGDVAAPLCNGNENDKINWVLEMEKNDKAGTLEGKPSTSVESNSDENINNATKVDLTYNADNLNKLDEFKCLAPSLAVGVIKSIVKYLETNVSLSTLKLSCSEHTDFSDNFNIYFDKRGRMGVQIYEVPSTVDRFNCKCKLHLAMVLLLKMRIINVMRECCGKNEPVRINSMIGYISICGYSIHDTLDHHFKDDIIYTPIAVSVKAIAHQLSIYDSNVHVSIRYMNYERKGRKMIVAIKWPEDFTENLKTVWLRTQIYTNIKIYWKNGITGFDLIPLKKKGDTYTIGKPILNGSSGVLNYPQLWSHRRVYTLDQVATNSSKFMIQCRAWTGKVDIPDNKILSMLSLCLMDAILDGNPGIIKKSEVKHDDSRVILTFPKGLDFVNEYIALSKYLQDTLNNKLTGSDGLLACFLQHLRNRVAASICGLNEYKKAILKVQFLITYKAHDKVEKMVKSNKVSKSITTSSASSSAENIATSNTNQKMYAELLKNKDIDISSVEDDVIVILPVVPVTMEKIMTSVADIKILTKSVKSSEDDLDLDFLEHVGLE